MNSIVILKNLQSRPDWGRPIKKKIVIVGTLQSRPDGDDDCDELNSIVIVGSYNPDQTDYDYDYDYNPDQREADRSTSTSTGSSSCDTPSGDEEVVKIMMMMWWWFICNRSCLSVSNKKWPAGQRQAWAYDDDEGDDDDDDDAYIQKAGDPGV